MSETREQQAIELAREVIACAASDFCKHSTWDDCVAAVLARALAACALEEARLAQQEFHEHFYLGSDDPDGLMECLDARVMALERAAKGVRGDERQD